MAPPTIQRLLEARASLRAAHLPEAALHHVRQGNGQAALATVPEPDRNAAAEAVRSLIRLGECGQALLECFVGDDRRSTWPVERRIETQCAGLFLLLRAVIDARLESVSKAVAGPTTESLSPMGFLLLALAGRWAGEAAIASGCLDPGLGVFAGIDRPPTLGALRHRASRVTPDDLSRLQQSVLRHLAGRRLLHPATLHIYSLTVDDGKLAVVAGDGASMWPLGRIPTEEERAEEITSQWVATWEAAAAILPEVIAVDAPLYESIGSGVFVGERRIDVHRMASGDRRRTGNGMETAHRNDRSALLAALGSIDAGRLGVPSTDLAIGLMSIALLRAWARWLRQFADASVPYLLETFVRRPGRLTVGEDSILVEMEPRPLDIIVDMAGYTDELSQVPWLGGRRIRFEAQGRS
jgi:hypothetical protein